MSQNTTSTQATMTATDPRTVKAKKLGRPPVFTKAQRRTVSKYLRLHGLTKGVELCEKETGIKVSIPTAIKIAKEKGVTFQRGRPSK